MPASPRKAKASGTTPRSTTALVEEAIAMLKKHATRSLCRRPPGYHAWRRRGHGRREWRSGPCHRDGEVWVVRPASGEAIGLVWLSPHHHGSDTELSIALLKRLGMKLDRKLQRFGAEQSVYSLSQERWKR